MKESCVTISFDGAIYADSHPNPPAPPIVDVEPDTVSFVGSIQSQNEFHLETSVTTMTASEVPETVEVAAPLNDVAELQEHAIDPNTPKDDIADLFAAIIEWTRPPDTMVIAVYGPSKLLLTLKSFSGKWLILSSMCTAIHIVTLTSFVSILLQVRKRI